MARFINIFSIVSVIVLLIANIIYMVHDSRRPLSDVFGKPVPAREDSAPEQAVNNTETENSQSVNEPQTQSESSINESKGLFDYEKNNIEIFNTAKASVVYVTNNALYRNYFTPDIMSVPQGTGTGFVWDKSGLIVTNYHVIRDAAQIIIKLIDKSTYEAKIIGIEPSKDLVLLKITAPAEKLKPLRIGTSSGLQVGRKVLAIGNPFGLDYTLTVGVISALGREIKSPSDMTISDVIQTDAAINPGNSGGPLLNSGGELIGINTQILSVSGGSSGIGFAIPVDTVKKIIPMLLKYGKVIRPYIGVSLLDDNTARYYNLQGAVIREVSENSPAKEIGLRGIRREGRQFYLGDVIVGIDSTPIESAENLLLKLEKYNAGDKVKLKIMRGEKVIQLTVKLGDSR